MGLEDAIYTYIETRDGDDLVKILRRDGSYLREYGCEIYRGFTCLRDSLREGDVVEQINFVTSWTTEPQVAEYFAKYNKELLKYDEVVLGELGIGNHEVDEYIYPVVFVCTNPVSVLAVEEHIDLSELVEVTNNEHEVVSFEDSQFTIDIVNFVSLDNYEGYLVNVSQYKR